MNILISIETLVTGGAETFCLRLAQALSQDNNIYLYRFYKERIDWDIITRLAPGVQLLTYDGSFDLIIRKFDSLLKKVRIDFSVRNYLIKRNIKRIINENSIEVIHSNQFNVDYILTSVAKSLKLPVITTIHGDYLNFWFSRRKGIRNFESKMLLCVERTDTITCISDVQLSFFNHIIQPLISKKLDLTKIYNGYTLIPELVNSREEIINTLNIPDEHLIFGMVSRGIPEKGWEYAIEAFIGINEKNSSLILVGQSSYLDVLKNKYISHKNVYFVGYSSNVIDWIRNFDVGLLPSFYKSESLPTVVIEYLICGKPVIASNAGEIENMIKVNNNELAGIIVPIEDNVIAVNLLIAAMQQYMQDEDLYKIHSANAKVAAQKFNMEFCVKKYTEIYMKNISKLGLKN